MLLHSAQHEQNKGKLEKQMHTYIFQSNIPSKTKGVGRSKTNRQPNKMLL